MIGYLALAVFVLGLLWRVTRYAVGFPMWGDEAFIVASLYTRGFADLFGPLEHSQIAPLGFMWAELAASRLLGFSEWALRSPAFICGLFSLVLFRSFAARILDRRSALLALAVFAASYYVVRHANEVKPYSSDLAVSLTITCLGWAVYRKPDSIRRWLALMVGSAVGVWLSYPAIFIGGAVAMLLALLVVRRTRLIPNQDLTRQPAAQRDGVPSKVLVLWLIYLAVLLGSFLAMYLLFASKHSKAALIMTEIRTWKPAFPPVSRPWLLPWWFLKIHTGNLLAYPIGGKYFGSTLTFLLVIAGAVTLWRGGRKDLLILLLGPLPLNFVAAAMKKYPYGSSARVSLYLAPAFCLLAGIGLAWVLRFWLSRKDPTRGLCLAVAVLALIPLAGTVSDIFVPTKKYSDSHNRQAAQELARLTGPKDQWIIFNSLKDVGYSPNIYTYGGSGARFRYYVRRFGPPKVAWAPPPGSVVGLETSKTWLIAYKDYKVPFPQELFKDYRKTLSDNLGQLLQQHCFQLTSPNDPPQDYLEAIEVYEFAPGRGPAATPEVRSP